MSTARAIPQYFVYGEPDRPLEIGFLHVERVRDRNTVHHGVVAAHTHRDMGQITFWTKGRGSYVIEDTPHEFRSPAVAFVPSDVVHGFTIAPGTDAIVVSVANDVLADLAGLARFAVLAPVFEQRGAPLAEWSRMRAVFDAILAEYLQGARGGDTVLAALVTTALAYVARLNSDRPAIETPPRVTLALRFRQAVNAHFRENRAIAGYIEDLGTTRHLLSRAATEVLGMSLNGVILERRMLEAKRLLHFTVRSVEDISFDVGFSDAAYFSRFFRQRTGQSPASWRAARLEASAAAAKR
jgi:AraC family transcriptional activator of pobA